LRAEGLALAGVLRGVVDRVARDRRDQRRGEQLPLLERRQKAFFAPAISIFFWLSRRSSSCAPIEPCWVLPSQSGVTPLSPTRRGS